jgi:hypothetical protein
MSKDLETFWRILEVRMPWTVVLSVSNGDPVIGWGWPSSSRAVRIGHDVCLPPI